MDIYVDLPDTLSQNRATALYAVVLGSIAVGVDRCQEFMIAVGLESQQ